MPIRLGGLGLRCQADISPLAYIGALEQSLPHFGGENGVCQPLAHLVDRNGDVSTRWRPLLESGCRTGIELARAWGCLQAEARASCQYLGQELTGSMSQPAEGIGEGAEDGSTRALLTKEREEMRAAVLKKALTELDPTARPVWSWKQRDKLSSAFLLNTPGAHSSLSTPVFQEAVAALLCAPSPVCRDRVGEMIGNKRVDLFGDHIVGQNLTGGGWTRRHDTVKSELNSCCGWAGLEAVCEPYGLFGQFLPQQPLNRVEYRRTRVCLRPDFLFQLPLASGQVERRIADVKTISLGVPSYYKPGAGGKRGVEIRDKEVPGEYRRTAAKMDRSLGHENGQGPVTRRLTEYGGVMPLCFGGHSEGSEEVHNLINILATARLKKVGLQRGRPGSDQELAIITSQLRRRISAATVRASFTLLLERMAKVGEGARRAESRRGLEGMEEERMRRDREAQWLARVRGVGLVHRGRFFA
jgi:hypothetical protein